MTSFLASTEIKRVKVYTGKCLKCKLTVMAGAVGKVFLVCKELLPKKRRL
jgi:hypothetical protein